MKSLIFVALFFQIFSIRIQTQKDIGMSINWVTPEYIDPVYYSCTPRYYTYFTSPIYYYFYGTPSYVTPTEYILFRKEGESKTNSTNKQEKQQPIQNLDKAALEAELKELKKSIWGNENYDTNEIRKTGKIYDPRWLIAQLQVTRVVELEDYLRLTQFKMNQLITQTQNQENKVNPPQTQPQFIPPNNQSPQNLNTAPVNNQPQVPQNLRKFEPGDQPSSIVNTQ